MSTGHERRIDLHIGGTKVSRSYLYQTVFLFSFHSSVHRHDGIVTCTIEGSIILACKYNYKLVRLWLWVSGQMYDLNSYLQQLPHCPLFPSNPLCALLVKWWSGHSTVFVRVSMSQMNHQQIIAAGPSRMWRDDVAYLHQVQYQHWQSICLHWRLRKLKLLWHVHPPFRRVWFPSALRQAFRFQFFLARCIGTRNQLIHWCCQLKVELVLFGRALTEIAVRWT